MLKPQKEWIVLEKTDLEFENNAVLNPTCIKENGIIKMFYRAVKEGNLSTIGYCELDQDNKVIKRLDKPLIVPEYSYEKQGLEDPRLVKLDNLYYLFYTGYDGKNARIAYATSVDLKKFKKHGTLSPNIAYDEAENIFREASLQERYFLFESYYKEKHGKDVLLWEKDAFLLPKKINNHFALFHRILPGIQMIYFKNFEELMQASFWKHYLKNLDDYVVLDPKHWFETRNIGGGCAPIETREGWLLIYHAVEDTSAGKVYHAAAALLEKDNPCKVIGRLSYPLFSPERSWEREGTVKNVVFPTGAVVDGDNLMVYYGAADKLIAAKQFSLSELIQEIKQSGT